MTTISSWGNTSSYDHEVIRLSAPNQIAHQLQQNSTGIAFGMGRSYGDVCLNPEGVLWKTTALNRFIQFDETSGRLVCEAGILLRDIQQVMVPRGWILPVTPGTQLVTVGGAIANDVHGKNHHQSGTFSNHVHWLKLIRTNGEIIECGPHLKPDWFAATVGGVGLTGIIAAAEIQLQRLLGPWLHVETIPYATLQEFFQLAESSEDEWEHTVSWFDCTSKKCSGLFMRAIPTSVEGKQNNAQRRLTVPIVLPLSLVNKFTVRPLNHAYYHLQKRRQGSSVMHYESFLYPLDNVLEWNRIYGSKGFFQYQAVLPQQDRENVIQSMIHEIGSSKEGSFISVLKTFGPQQSIGMLSFPQSGVSLALDFPNRGASTFKLFQRLDNIVGDAGGRLYLAKDACMSKTLFTAGYPRLEEFLNYRDPGISSALSRRLMGY